MRKIKFRAWDKENKEMVLDVQKTYDDRCCDVGAMHTSFGTLIADEDFVIMQYTGLKDKNNKLIFEGDIMKDKYKVKCLVGFGENTDRTFLGFYLDYFETTNTRYLIPTQKEVIFFKVIGNKFDNPELLK